MKKIFSFILAIGLASIPVVAESPSVDLSAMTLDELVELRDRVNFEIDSLVYSGDSTIGRGTYTVGISIAPGVYEFMATEVEIRAGSECYIDLYGVEDKENPKTEIYDILIGTSVIIELVDGDTLEIRGGSGILKKAEKTWMP